MSVCQHRATGTVGANNPDLSNGGTVKSKKLLDAVEESTQAAVEHLSPYVEQAIREGADIADLAYSRLRPAIKDATIRGARLAADTFERVHPAIDEAIDRVPPAVDATVMRVRPAVDDVFDKIPPSVEFARGKVQDDLLPTMAEQLRQLAAQPLAKELQVAAASAALAAQLDKATGKKKRSGWKTFGRLVLAGAVLGGVAYAVKKLLADPSSGWETYTPRDSAYVADPVAAEEEPDAVGIVDDELEDVVAPAAEEGGDADPLADSPYGEGSYIGDEPPEGFTIKGNDRSKKYHIPGSASYERTSAEVWFVSEEAAQAAGFVKAQR
jgi:hypothetical protein